MNTATKKSLVGLAAGAFGMALVGCGGAQSSQPTTPEQASGNEAAAGQASCGGAKKDTAGGEASCSSSAKAPADGGGEHSCGASSCGGR